MKLKTIITASFCLTAATTASYADSDPMYGASSSTHETRFDGAYGGIEGGIDWTKKGENSSTDTSAYYGGVLGYRKQLSNDFVYGLEATLGDTGFGDSTKPHSNYEWSSSITFGKALGKNLIYGKAGYAETRFDRPGKDSYTDSGIRFGGGYERAFTDKISFRLGTDYTSYGRNVSDWQTKAGVLYKF